MPQRSPSHARAPRSRLAWVLCAVFASIPFARAPYVCAQDQTQGSASARELFEQGVALSAAGSWREAADHFRRSAFLDARCSTLFNLAVSLDHLGEPRELLAVAQQYLLRANAEVDATDIPEVLRLRDAARGHIARIAFELSPSKSNVVIDGEDRTRDAHTGQVVIEPGKHALHLSAQGYVSQDSDISLNAGEIQSLHVSLVVQPSAATARPDNRAPVAATSAAHAPGDTEGGGSWLSSPVFWVVTAVVVAAGVTTGVLIANQAAETRGPTHTSTGVTL